MTQWSISPRESISDTTYFDECFLFHAITGRHFFIEIYRYPEVWCNRHYFEEKLAEVGNPCRAPILSVNSGSNFCFQALPTATFTLHALNVKLTKLVLQIECPSCHLAS